MEHQLPKCKGATEEDIVTTCFRTFRSIPGTMPRGIQIVIWPLTVDYTERDSSKDQAVVFIFIIATAGLLLWAAAKPWVERWIQVGNVRISYCTIPRTWAMAVLTKVVEQNRQLENDGHTSLFPHRRMAIDSFIPIIPGSTSLSDFILSAPKGYIHETRTSYGTNGVKGQDSGVRWAA